jgi:hypothetical protein
MERASGKGGVQWGDPGPAELRCSGAAGAADCAEEEAGLGGEARSRMRMIGDPSSSLPTALPDLAPRPPCPRLTKLPGPSCCKPAPILIRMGSAVLHPHSFQYPDHHWSHRVGWAERLDFPWREFILPRFSGPTLTPEPRFA